MTSQPLQPDYAVPPGDTLAEWLEERHMRQAELASRINMSEKALSQIITGVAPLTRATAGKLELATGIPARTWNGLEALYQDDRARLAQRAELEGHREWLAEMPVAALRKLGVLAALRAVDCAVDLLPLPGRWHVLTGNWAGHMSADLDHPYRLLVRPQDSPAPTGDGGVDWVATTAMTVVGIFDTQPSASTAMTAAAYRIMLDDVDVAPLAAAFELSAESPGKLATLTLQLTILAGVDVTGVPVAVGLDEQTADPD